MINKKLQKRSRGNTQHSKKPHRSNYNKSSHTRTRHGSIQKPNVKIPSLSSDSIRIIPLGGVEEIGRNMTSVEFGDDIIVLDCGFGFGGDDVTPGIDYILPNTEYLEMNRDKIRAVLITHGHLDHIGGIPFIIDRIGNPPIYTRKLTGVMIKKRQEEFPHLAELDLREVESNSVVKIGNLNVRFFSVTHTIPDSMGIIIETPYGDIVNTGDIKLDHVNGVPTDEEYEVFGIFKNRNVLALLMDSTSVWKPGWSVPESAVFEEFKRIIPETKNRLIIGTFASQLERLMRIVQITEDCGKKLVVDGRSMKTNIDIVRELGILKHKDKTIVPVEEIEDYPPEKIVVIATGAQGDQYASLMRMGDKTHKYIQLRPDDTVVLSSSVIPGNEISVQLLKDNISRQGVKIVTYYETNNVHSSGHGSAEEAKWIHKQIRPKFFMPQHGHHYMLRVHADLIQESIGIPKENIAIPDNSSIIEIQDGGKKIVKLKEKAPDSIRVVEGRSMGELSSILMRDRRVLAQDGFCVVVATIDKRTGKLHKSPDILSRGFVYLRDNKSLIDQARLIVRRSVERSFKNPRSADMEDAKRDMAMSVARFLLQQTKKRPIVIPVIVTI